MFVKPYFFDTFKCKAGDCTDSCCIGWEIDIDEISMGLYNCVNGDFGKRLKDNIVTQGDCSFFSLCDNDRCPFLNRDNLCDIYINLGEESLCDICKEHPRFYNEFAGRCEAGIGLCCEKVCEILFEDESPLDFIIEDDGYEDDFNDFEKEIMLMRQNVFFEIRNRSERFFDRLSFISDLKFNNDTAKQIVDVFAATEPINNEWTEYINRLKSVASELAFVNYEFKASDYEKLLIYIIYRHFTKSVFDGKSEKWLIFSIVNLFFVHIMDLYSVYTNGKYDFADRINNVKLWSKQIEYSEENINYIADCFYSD